MSGGERADPQKYNAGKLTGLGISFVNLGEDEVILHGRARLTAS